MSHYPTDETSSDSGPECPNCGHEFSTDDGQYYPRGMEETFEDEECPECGIKLDISVSTTVTWNIEHPQKCVIKGYHVPFISPEYNKHECLYCNTPLTCDCTLHDRCTHNLKTKEEVLS